jgi:hypothetical protein
MNPRSSRPAPRGAVAPMHRGPQADRLSAPTTAPPSAYHAPNAAMLIDFDNVTMGIQSNLQTELRSLLSSSIIQGKVSVQRAYADWRRYPQYIVPLAESSIDLIFAPAYGSSKKNATDIRLAIDALELVFTRPRSGRSSCSRATPTSRASSSSSRSTASTSSASASARARATCSSRTATSTTATTRSPGLVRNGEEEVVRYDPWELVTGGDHAHEEERRRDALRPP